MISTSCVQLKETLIKSALSHAGEYDLQDVGNVARGHGVRSDQHPRLHGCRRYDYTEVIGRKRMEPVFQTKPNKLLF